MSDEWDECVLDHNNEFGFRDEMWCRYNKHHDPNNPYFFPDGCIDLFNHDGKRNEFMIISCPLFPFSDNSDIKTELNKALDRIEYKGDRNKVKYV